MIRIVFFGTDVFAIGIFKALLSAPGIEVVALVTKPATPQGRGLRLVEPPIVVHAPTGMPILQPLKLDTVFAQQLRALQPDLSLVVVYGKIIPSEILDVPRLKTWNVHPSLLPAYRGPSPIVSAILNGDAYTGTSIMLLDSEMDHGPVFAQEKLSIEPNDTSDTLRDKLAALSAPLLITTIHQAAEGAIQPKEQDHTRASYTKKFSAEDYKLDFQQSAKEVARHIRAFPGEAWFILPNGKRCKVWSATIVEHKGTTGEVTCDKKSCVVACADTAIALNEVLVEGKSKMSGEAFAQGYARIFPQSH